MKRILALAALMALSFAYGQGGERRVTVGDRREAAHRKPRQKKMETGAHRKQAENISKMTLSELKQRKQKLEDELKPIEQELELIQQEIERRQQRRRVSIAPGQ